MKYKLIIAITLSVIAFSSFCVKNVIVGIKNDWQDVSVITTDEIYYTDVEARQSHPLDWDISKEYFRTEITSTTIKPNVFWPKTVSEEIIKTEYWERKK